MLLLVGMHCLSAHGRLRTYRYTLRMVKPCLHANFSSQTFTQHEQLVAFTCSGTQTKSVSVAGMVRQLNPVRRAEATLMMHVQGGLGSTDGAV